MSYGPANRRWYLRNRKRILAEQKAYKRDNPHVAARARRKARYGMTEEQWQAAVKLQRGRCGICRQKRPLQVDHNHRTGAIRGLLCGSCNKGLSAIFDHPRLLKAALKYVGM